MAEIKSNHYLWSDVDEAQRGSVGALLANKDCHLATDAYAKAVLFCTQNGFPVSAIRVLVSGGRIERPGEATFLLFNGSEWVSERRNAQCCRGGSFSYGVVWLFLTEGSFDRGSVRQFGRTKKANQKEGTPGFNLYIDSWENEQTILQIFDAVKVRLRSWSPFLGVLALFAKIVPEPSLDEIQTDGVNFYVPTKLSFYQKLPGMSLRALFAHHLLFAAFGSLQQPPSVRPALTAMGLGVPPNTTFRETFNFTRDLTAFWRLALRAALAKGLVNEWDDPRWQSFLASIGLGAAGVEPRGYRFSEVKGILQGRPETFPEEPLKQYQLLAQLAASCRSVSDTINCMKWICSASKGAYFACFSFFGSNVMPRMRDRNLQGSLALRIIREANVRKALSMYMSTVGLGGQ